MKTNTTRSGVLSKEEDIDAFETSGDEGADAFLNRWKDNSAESSSAPQGEEEEVEEEVAEAEQADTETEEQTEDETSEESTDEPQEDEGSEEETAEGEESEGDESTEEEAPKVLKDDAEVEIKVGEDTLKVPVKDLKRLYGQEAALTKKTQQVAAQRKQVEAEQSKVAASIDLLYKRAQAKWEPYSKVDMLLASKELDTETFAALRKEAQEAHEEFSFISKEAEQFVQQAEAQRLETLRAKAAEAIPVLKEKIPGWSDEVYNKIRSFAVSQGMDANMVSSIVDPAAIILLNKARLYDEGKNVVLKKKVKVPAKVIKAGNTTASDITPDKSQAALKRLRSSGNTEDAADAFLSRWSV